MDGRGRWHNQHGPFENKKIIDFFNASIQWDNKGYHVIQQREGLIEKVYFSYEDTALFVVDIKDHTLVLNTYQTISLMPEALFVSNDHLYTRHQSQRIKFSDRALLKLADKIKHEKDQYFYCEDDQRHRISDDNQPTSS